jgi:hypothetical protein
MVSKMNEGDYAVIADEFNNIREQIYEIEEK